MTIVKVLPQHHVITTFQMKEKQDLTHYIIAGPTASGKSSRALDLAFKVGGIIVNADSLQIYRGLPILTAQPSRDDLKIAPHYLYDFLEPHESYSAQKWVEYVSKILHATEVPAILVGGTGFYFKALLEGLSPIPDVDPEIQEQVRKLSLGEVRTQLSALDPEISARLHPHDHQRNARALEIILSSGQSILYWQSLKSEPSPFRFHKIGIFPEKENHQITMKKRVIQMWENGAIDEVKAMMELNLPDSAPAKKAIGYHEIEDYLKGNMTESQAQELMIIKTRQYAKRQRTWFRNQMKFDEILKN